MPKMRKGQKLVCVPCGREVVVNSAGVARTTIWCCGTSMKSPGTAKKKAAPKKKAVAKKKAAPKKKVVRKKKK